MGGPWVYKALCFSKRILAQLEHLQLRRIQLLLKSFNNLISGSLAALVVEEEAVDAEVVRLFNILFACSKKSFIEACSDPPSFSLSLSLMMTSPPPLPFKVVAFVERCHSNSLVWDRPATCGRDSRNSHIFFSHL